VLALLHLLAAAPVVHRLRRLVPLVRMLRPELAAVPIPFGEAQALGVLRSLFAEPSRMPSDWFAAAAGGFGRGWGRAGARPPPLARTRRCPKQV